MTPADVQRIVAEAGYGPVTVPDPPNCATYGNGSFILWAWGAPRRKPVSWHIQKRPVSSPDGRPCAELEIDLADPGAPQALDRFLRGA